MLASNAESAYGRAHGFGGIRSAREFRDRVPIIDDHDLEPWIERIKRGEQSVLTCEPVLRLVPTSGTTAGRKLIPFTASFQKEISAAIGPWMVNLCREHPSVPFGPAYWSISPAIPDTVQEKSVVPIGFDDDSTYLGGIRRRLAEATFAVPSVLCRVGDVDCSRYLTLLCLLRSPELRLVSVWHPSFLALLLDALPTHWDELLDDLARGGCRRAKELPREIRRAFHAPPQPSRAEKLRRANPANPQSIWEHLRVVSCWGDGHATLAMKELQQRLPHLTIQPKGLLATEAFVSIPFGPHHPLAVTSHFFEFTNARGEMFLAHELCRGETYSVVVTTGAGLWRYRLGDLVEVDGFLDATPSLRFLGRSGGVSDLCGEKLAETFVASALEAACALFDFTPRFAMLAPERDGAECWGYTLFVEGRVPSELPVCLDGELRKNPHYALCRDLSQLGPLRCVEIESGAYETFCQISASAGRRLGDIKPQILSSRTDWRSHFAPKFARGVDSMFRRQPGERDARFRPWC